MHIRRSAAYLPTKKKTPLIHCEIRAEKGAKAALNLSNMSNVDTVYSRDKKKKLRLTIVDREPKLTFGVNTVSNRRSAKTCLLGPDEKTKHCDKLNPSDEDQPTAKQIMVKVDEPVTIVTSGGSYRMPSYGVPTTVGEPKVAIDLQTRDEIYMVVGRR